MLTVSTLMHFHTFVMFDCVNDEVCCGSYYKCVTQNTDNMYREKCDWLVTKGHSFFTAMFLIF